MRRTSAVSTVAAARLTVQMHSQGGSQGLRSAQRTPERYQRPRTTTRSRVAGVLALEARR